MTKATPSIEARLEEFNQVHGTVLLGMHQRLETVEESTRNLCERAAATLGKAELCVSDALKKLSEDSISIFERVKEARQLVERYEQHATTEAARLETALNAIHSRIEYSDNDREHLRQQLQKLAQGTQRIVNNLRETQQRLADSMTSAQSSTTEHVRSVQTTLEEFRLLTLEQSSKNNRLQRLLWLALALAGFSLSLATIILFRSWIA